MDERTLPGDERAQTAIDFLVGMTVFFIAVGFVFVFTPGMFDPFQTGSGPKLVEADRAAATLTTHLLVEDPAEPGVLNATCTTDYFDGVDNAECRYDGTDLEESLAIRDVYQISVVIRDPGEGVLHEQGGDPGGDVVNASRSVLLDGDQVRVYVRVW